MAEYRSRLLPRLACESFPLDLVTKVNRPDQMSVSSRSRTWTASFRRFASM